MFCARKRPKKPFREDVFLKTQRTARERRTAQTFLTISKNRFLEVSASIVSNCPVSAGRLPSHNIFFLRIERLSCHDFFDLQFFSCLQRLLCFVDGRLPPETSMSSLFSFFVRSDALCRHLHAIFDTNDKFISFHCFFCECLRAGCGLIDVISTCFD